MARTYRTVSLSLPPEAVARLEARARTEGKTAARVAAEVVLRDVSMSEALPDPSPDEQGGPSMLLHECIVHERDARGLFSRQYQTLSLVDITRIRGGKIGLIDVRLDGEWLEIEGDIEEFKGKWQSAKGGAQ